MFYHPERLGKKEPSPVFFSVHGNAELSDSFESNAIFNSGKKPRRKGIFNTLVLIIIFNQTSM